MKAENTREWTEVLKGCLQSMNITRTMYMTASHADLIESKDIKPIVNTIAEGEYGFASEIAKTVASREYKCSEKQAYWIAKAICENGFECDFVCQEDLDCVEPSWA